MIKVQMKIDPEFLARYWDKVSQARQQWWDYKFPKYMGYLSGDDREVVQDQETSAGNGKGFTVVHWSRLAMFDWDISVEPLVTKMHGQWEFPLLKKQLEWLVKQGMGLRLYKTPGGVRGFLTSYTPDINEWVEMANWLHCDIQYVAFTAVRHFTPLNGWACRVSPKPGREGDYVARLVGQWGPVSDELKTYIEMHDRLVQRFHNA